jgi:hypothetical protein
MRLDLRTYPSYSLDMKKTPNTPPAARCDLCHSEIRPGESFQDDGDEVAHTSCSRDWFRRNFGREGLGA